MLLIRQRAEEHFLFIWDTQIVDERHFFFCFDEIIRCKWTTGISILLTSERTKEMYVSFYPSERMFFYENLATRIRKILTRDETEAKIKLVG